MGGCGSGRHWDSKATTSDFHQLDVRAWERKVLLVRFGSFASGWWHVDVVPSSFELRDAKPEWLVFSRSDRGNEKYPVQLEWTACNYGGSRVWFRCPTKGCGRRVAILYGKGDIACRHCRQLAYDSQRDSGWHRSVRRAQTARMKLGGSAILAEPLPQRPKGMHMRTYRRLFINAAQREEAVFGGALSRLTALEQQISHFAKTQGRAQ